ncbi:MAG: hypothetical protein GXO62_03305 [Epsilonproteobacteria bacterium]|nr:hypothetical protein [Campylobacterota bacterium]
MKILNKPFCNEEFIKAKNKEDIKKSPPNSTLLFDYDESLFEEFAFCKENNIPFGVFIQKSDELVFISNFKAKYALTDNLEHAKVFQKIVDDYLLDIRVVFLINSLQEIKDVIPYRIDAVKLKEHK